MKAMACECIDTRLGAILTAGGEKPVFILELYSDSAGSLIKYLNCNSTTSGAYKVPLNSDFAKLYRVTLGSNPRKRYSRAHQLLPHFRGCRFNLEYETAARKKGQQYLKVTEIWPTNPVANDDWTSTGALRKRPQKTISKPSKIGDDEVTARLQVGEKEVKNWLQVGDDKTLEAAKTLGIGAIPNPIKPLPTPSETTKPLPHCTTPDVFYYAKQAGESISDYFDRVIDETFLRVEVSE